MTAYTFFKDAEKTYLSLLDSIKTDENMQILSAKKDTVVNAINGLKLFIDDKITNRKYKEISYSYVANIYEYMNRLALCLYKDCHPEKYPDWQKVDPSDQRWNDFYIQLCVDDVNRNLKNIDHMVRQDNKLQNKYNKI